MHIQLETPDKNTIRAYGDDYITVSGITYHHSIIINKETILEWSVRTLQELNEATLEPILQANPEVIIIGHQQLGSFAPLATRLYLTKKHIGLECMSIGAASRTFNVLLSEHRKVVAGIIF